MNVFNSQKPTFYECGICNAYHNANWNGDCREDMARLDLDYLDKQYGRNGWTEMDMADLP